MITKNTEYSIQRLRGLSTDTKPTDVPNGSEFREMDTGKDFMYDEASGDWKEQPKKGGGGGGGGGVPMTKLAEISVSENVRSIAVTPSANWFDYDYLLVDYDLSLLRTDWIYVSKVDENTSTPSYTIEVTPQYSYVGISTKRAAALRFYFPDFKGGALTDISSGETLYMFTYEANNSIVSGSSIKVYGGYKNDL